MQIFRRIDDVLSGFGPTVVSIGNFDGVHLGHRHVLDEIVGRAQRNGMKSVVVTFDPHPARILRPDAAPKLLTPTLEKLRLLEKTGLDAVLLLPFTRDISLLPPTAFVESILKDCLHAAEVHEGSQFRFGHQAAGDVALLSDLGRQMGFSVEIYPELRVRGEAVSSSHIRKLLGQGRVGAARHLLGRTFSILSTPDRGRGYGSKFTVPTINLSTYPELLPQNGVYVTETRVARDCFQSVTNLGNRPTFGADSFAVESHLLNFHPVELTAETEVELLFLKRLRDERRFDSPEALRAQIALDVEKAKRYFRLRNVCLAGQGC